jgi:hypothetical protein
LPIL